MASEAWARQWRAAQEALGVPAAQLEECIVAAAARLGARLQARDWMAVTAESCTGGAIARALTETPGSSVWFDRGWVTYSNAAKREMLGVAAATLDRHGAVSGETALEMARGAVAATQRRLALAVTGVAGPGGGSPDKPVGTVWFAWALAGAAPTARRALLPGDRHEVRLRSVLLALEEGIDLADRIPPADVA